MPDVIRLRIREIASGESGSVIVVGAIVVVVFALLGSAVIEVGQWFQHRRNLQVRTDAAALAGGQALAACFNIGTAQFPTEQAADDYIESWAQNYGGFTSSASTQIGAPYNRQFGTGTSFMSFQSDMFPSAGPQPPRTLGPECFADGDPNNTDPQNVNLMADVRTTQSGITPFFSFSPFATTHGWARVQLQTVKALKPSMPLAIPDVRPSHVAVTFVDNNTGQALACTGAPIGSCTFPLPGPPTSSGTLNVWSGQATIPMPAAGANVGVRVSIGNTDGDCAGINAVTTAGGTNYTCYDYSNTGQAAPNGIVAIRSYDGTTAGTTTAPRLREVTPVSCSGTPYFSAYQATGGSCVISVLANVDFGSGADLTQAQVSGTIRSLGGGGGGGIPITLSHTTGNQWASGPISLPTRGGAYSVTLKWKYGSGGFTNFNAGNPVQQIFSGSDGSDSTLPGGPIFAASVSDLSGNPAYSLPAATPATVAVTIGLTGGVHLNPRCFTPPGNVGAAYVCASDPTDVLRTANTSGSVNYTINCGIIPGNPGPNSPLYQMIRYGCRDSFSLNQPDVCPDNVTTPPPNPTDCAPVQSVTGDKVGPVQRAMNDRIAPNNNCARNNYPDTTDDSDPRIMRLVDTDFSAFNGNGGNQTVPVITFATFYITGWDGAVSSCGSYNEPPPPNAISNGNSADIWGHFIKDDVSGTPSGLKCKVTELAPCVPALVR